MTIDYMPCLTRGRGASAGCVLLYAGRIRWTTLNELAKLQWLSLQHVRIEGAINTHAGSMVGHAMRVCALDRNRTMLRWSAGMLNKTCAS